MKFSKKFSQRNIDGMFRLISSDSLGTDHPSSLANHQPAIFLQLHPTPHPHPIPPGTEQLISPLMQTKSPDNSNVLHMFNNNNCTDF